MLDSLGSILLERNCLFDHYLLAIFESNSNAWGIRLFFTEDSRSSCQLFAVI